MRSILILTIILNSGASTAALHDRGSGLIYDDALNITWLQDANYYAKIKPSSSGQLSWLAANSWAENLTYGGYDDWRLPTVRPADGVEFHPTLSPVQVMNLPSYYSGELDSGFNVTRPTNELAYMFHVTLRNKGAFTALGAPRPGLSGQDWGVTNSGPFTLPNLWYWTTVGSVNVSTPNHAWAFYANGGLSDYTDNRSEFLAWAVRDGDSVSSIPEPKTGLQLTLGLALLGLYRAMFGRTKC